jgi:hypothetical protein
MLAKNDMMHYLFRALKQLSIFNPLKSVAQKVDSVFKQDFRIGNTDSADFKIPGF